MNKAAGILGKLVRKGIAKKKAAEAAKAADKVMPYVQAGSVGALGAGALAKGHLKKGEFNMTKAEHILEKIADITLYRAKGGERVLSGTKKKNPGLARAVGGSKSSQAPYSYFEGIDEAEMSGDPGMAGVYSPGLEPGMVGWGGRKQDPDFYHSPADKKKTKVVKKGKIYTTKTAGAAGTMARIAKRVGPHLALPGAAVLGAVGISKYKKKQDEKQPREKIPASNVHDIYPTYKHLLKKWRGNASHEKTGSALTPYRDDALLGPAVAGGAYEDPLDNAMADAEVGKTTSLPQFTKRYKTMANQPTWEHESPKANRNVAAAGGIIGAGGSLLTQTLKPDSLVRGPNWRRIGRGGFLGALTGLILKNTAEIGALRDRVEPGHAEMRAKHMYEKHYLSDPRTKALALADLADN